jgi:hypothetical protein
MPSKVPRHASRPVDVAHIELRILYLSTRTKEQLVRTDFDATVLLMILWNPYSYRSAPEPERPACNERPKFDAIPHIQPYIDGTYSQLGTTSPFGTPFHRSNFALHVYQFRSQTVGNEASCYNSDIEQLSALSGGKC